MKNRLNQLRDLAQRQYLKAGVAVGSLIAAGGAFAQSVDPFETATDTITTKIETYGAALVGVAAVGVIFMVAMKYVKKLPRAS